MASSSKPKGRKGRIGKNKSRIAVYYGNGRNYWNKARKIVHHVRRQEDVMAWMTLKGLIAAMSLAMGRQFKAQYGLE